MYILPEGFSSEMTFSKPRYSEIVVRDSCGLTQAKGVIDQHCAVCVEFPERNLRIRSLPYSDRERAFAHLMGIIVGRLS